MRVFVTWAHRGELWSETQALIWQQTVERFAGLLDAEDGIDVTLDLWHEHDPALDWTRWGPRQIDLSDYVLIAINEPWAERWTGTNRPDVGPGAVAEADALKGLFFTNQQDFQKKVRIILLPGVGQRDIPKDLWRSKRATVATLSKDGITSVIDELRNQSRPRPSTTSPDTNSTVPGSALLLPEDLLLFRFRDLPHPAIRNHLETLSANPDRYVWWGWWKKFEENPQLELWKAFRDLTEQHGGRVALFDSGSPTGEVRRASVSDVLVPRTNEFDDPHPFTPDSDEWQFIPEYYRPSAPNDSISCAWLCLTSIEDRPFRFYGRYEFVSADTAFSGVIIREPSQLKEQDQSLWHVRRTGR